MSVLFSVYAPGSMAASNYISICNDAVGDIVFLYEHLIRNKIVPERWFTLNELSIVFGTASGQYTIYKRKPKKEVMSLRPIRGFFPKKKSPLLGLGSDMLIMGHVLRHQWSQHDGAPQTPQAPQTPEETARVYRNMKLELEQLQQRAQQQAQQVAPLAPTPTVLDDPWRTLRRRSNNI